MTRETMFVPTKRKNAVSYGQICFGAFSLFCMLLLLKNADIAIGSIKEGLALCAKAVIPSLFPFMVLSELILSGNLFQSLFKKLTYPLQALFHLSSTGCRVLLMGLLCGFPIGARCAVKAYESGQLSREETERVLLFSNVPSSAFLINVVGVSLFQSYRLGLLLWGLVLSSSLLVGLFFCRWKKKKEDFHNMENPPSIQKSSNGAALFTGAVASATRSMILVCAYVIFFSALAGALNSVLQVFHIPPFLQALTFGILELSGGVNQAARLFEPHLAIPLCAFAAGWSGLSVHCQVLSVCEGRNLSFGNYFLAKLLQGILCAAFCIAFLHFMPVNFFSP